MICLSAFLILVGTAMASFVLGTNGMPRLDARLSLSVQFVLLGLSFDALRQFYLRVLRLLDPQTAVALVVRDCNRQLGKVRHYVERLINIYSLAGGTSEAGPASRALLFTASRVPMHLRGWIVQLDEFALKLLAHRDTNAATEVITAMAAIGQQYAETRRSSLILTVDGDNFLIGGTSDVENVLNPIYESIRVITEDATKSSNEIVVRHCLKTLGALTTHLMTLVHSRPPGWQTAPLRKSITMMSKHTCSG
jgi:hypothetical protein